VFTAYNVRLLVPIIVYWLIDWLLCDDSKNRLLVLCHCVQFCIVHSVHCLSVPHTVPSVGSVSLCPMLSSTFCPLSVNTSPCTVCWFCVTVSTAVFHILSTVCQYFTLYSLLVLWHYVHCCLLNSVHCLSILHPVQSVGSVSLCPILYCTFCPLSVSTSHRTVCWFCVAVFSFVLYNMSTVCQYLTLYRLLVLCHCVHCCLLHSVQCLSVPQLHWELVLCHCVHCWFVESVYCLLVPKNVPSPLFCVIMSNTVFYSLSNDCQYLQMYRLLVLCRYVHCWILKSVHCLSEPHNKTSVDSVSLCPLLSSKICPLSVGTSHITVCRFCVTVPIFSSKICPLSVPLNLQSLHCLSVPHTVKSDHTLSVF